MHHLLGGFSFLRKLLNRGLMAAAACRPFGTLKGLFLLWLLPNAIRPLQVAVWSSNNIQDPHFKMYCLNPTPT